MRPSSTVKVGFASSETKKADSACAMAVDWI
jgi:hypothetical protein